MASGLIDSKAAASLSPPNAFIGRLPEDFPALGELFLGFGRVETTEGAAAFLEPGPKGYSGLSHSQAGRTVRLTSAMDPLAEDRRLVDKAEFDPGRGLLCCGLGLAYHLEELIRRLEPQAPLWVLESRPELAALALINRDLTELFERPGFRLFIGPFQGEPWGPEETPPAQVLWRPATARHFAAEYPVAGSRPLPRPRLASRRILLFQGGYFLDQELSHAAEALGHATAVWHFQRGPRGSGREFQELLALIKSFRPDLVLTVNHLGFDAEGIMDDLFTRLKLPVASWFVDSPAFILGPGRPSPYVSAFSWDRDYLPFLERQGFAQVRHLPLATDETLFQPSAGPAVPERPVAFVGDSLTAATEKYLGKIGLTAGSPAGRELVARADQLAADFLTTPALRPEARAMTELARALNLQLDPEGAGNLAALVTWRASRRWRLEVLSALAELDLTVAGDHHWSALLKLLPQRLRPPLAYGRELADFYQSSAVNINITSAQMKTGLNQRIFDVPAAGGFLLTDFREQLADLFEPDREVVTYNSPQQARALAAWYAGHPAARAKIAAAARRRIMNNHLYRHRLAELLAALKT